MKRFLAVRSVFEPPINLHSHRPYHHFNHNHTTAAVIAALAANAVCAGNSTLPGIAAFTRKQRFRRTPSPTQSPSPPADPPTNPSPHRRRGNGYNYDKSGGAVAIAAVSTRSFYSSEQRKGYGRGRAEALPEGAMAGVRGERRTTTLGGAEALRKGASGGVTGGADHRRDECCRDRRGEPRSYGRRRKQALPEGRAPAIPEGASTSVTGGGNLRRDRGESGALRPH